MADKNKHTNWGQTIVASVGLVSVAIVAIVLKEPAALLGIIGVIVLLSWID